MQTYCIVYSAVVKAALRRGSVLHSAAPGIRLLNCLRNSLLNVERITHSPDKSRVQKIFASILYAILRIFFFHSACNIGKAILNLLSDICMQAELNAHKVTFIKRILILQNRVPESQLLK